MDERDDRLTDAELEQWYRFATTRDDERTIGSMARDQKIRRLIEELRRERRRRTERPSE